MTWESFVFGLLMASGALVGFGVGGALLGAAEATVRWWVQRSDRRGAALNEHVVNTHAVGRRLGAGWRVDLGAVAEEITSTPLAEAGADDVARKLRRIAGEIVDEFQRREALAERVNDDLDSRVGGGRS